MGQISVNDKIFIRLQLYTRLQQQTWSISEHIKNAITLYNFLWLVNQQSERKSSTQITHFVSMKKTNTLLLHNKSTKKWQESLWDYPVVFVSRLRKAYAFLQQAEWIVGYNGWRWMPSWCLLCQAVQHLHAPSTNCTALTHSSAHTTFTPHIVATADVNSNGHQSQRHNCKLYSKVCTYE